jgi:hypothetical protein
MSSSTNHPLPQTPAKFHRYASMHILYTTIHYYTIYTILYYTLLYYLYYLYYTPTSHREPSLKALSNFAGAMSLGDGEGGAVTRRYAYTYIYIDA